MSLFSTRSWYTGTTIQIWTKFYNSPTSPKIQNTSKRSWPPSSQKVGSAMRHTKFCFTMLDSNCSMIKLTKSSLLETLLQINTRRRASIVRNLEEMTIGMPNILCLPPYKNILLLLKLKKFPFIPSTFWEGSRRRSRSNGTKTWKFTLRGSVTTPKDHLRSWTLETRKNLKINLLILFRRECWSWSEVETSSNYTAKCIPKDMYDIYSDSFIIDMIWYDEA